MATSLGRLQLQAPQGTGSRRMFVSYAHADGQALGDGDLPRAVVEALLAQARNDRELGVDADTGIFFDRSSLTAGSRWEERIRSEIDQADVFVLLMSLRTMNSRACMDDELQWAAKAGALVVPVLMSDCPWTGRLFGGGELGQIDAVPKDRFGNLVPIVNWPQRDDALAATARQIATALRGLVAPRPARASAGASARQAKALSPLLPLFCNQENASSDFQRCVGSEWEPGRALVVLIKGGHDDHPEGFWERLCERELRQACEALGQAVRPAKRLKLPNAMTAAAAAGAMTAAAAAGAMTAAAAAGVSTAGAAAGGLRASLAEDVRAGLSEALAGNMFRLKTGADFAEALGALHAVQPLLATLPVQPDEGNCAVLGALFDCLEATPRRAALDRLAIAVQVADPVLCTEAKMAERWRLAGRARVQVIELHPLESVDAGDVIAWHADYELAAAGIELPPLQALFRPEQPALRMRPFVAAVRPLLRL